MFPVVKTASRRNQLVCSVSPSCGPEARLNTIRTRHRLRPAAARRRTIACFRLVGIDGSRHGAATTDRWLRLRSSRQDRSMGLRFCHSPPLVGQAGLTISGFRNPATVESSGDATLFLDRARNTGRGCRLSPPTALRFPGRVGQAASCLLRTDASRWPPARGTVWCSVSHASRIANMPN